MKKPYLILSVLTLAASLALALFMYPGLPLEIAIHWDGAGRPDGYGRRETVFLWPALMAAVLLFGELGPRFSRTRLKIDTFIDTWWFAQFAVVAMLGFVQVVSMLAQQRGGLDVGTMLVSGMAVFIGLLGNVMGKVRRNNWLGVRTPWTLASDRVWYATHRLAGKSMVIGALLCIGMVLAGLDPQAAFIVLIGAALLPAAYSWWYYKRLEKTP